MTRMYMDKLIPGIVLQQLGPITCSVETADGHIVKRHVDQLSSQVEQDTVPDIDPPVLDNHIYTAGGTLGESD